MTVKHRISKLEKKVAPFAKGSTCKTRIVTVPDGLTRAEQDEFMANYPAFEEHDIERENLPQPFHSITYFIVGMPIDRTMVLPPGHAPNAGSDGAREMDSRRERS